MFGASGRTTGRKDQKFFRALTDSISLGCTQARRDSSAKALMILEYKVPGREEYVVQHLGRKSPGLSILLTRVVAAD